MDKKEVVKLLEKYHEGIASPEEVLLLELWYLKNTESDAPLLQQDENQIKGEIWSKLAIEGRKKNIRSIPYRVAAACLLIGLCVGLLLYQHSITQDKKTLLAKAMESNDRLPGGNRAILTLSNGNSINLNENQLGILVQEGEITRHDGTSLYTSQQTELALLKTPNGGQSQIVLSDGTKVWLNAASSLKFPTHFSPDSREVEVEGEAYFEVARLTGKNNQPVPFSVRSDQQTIEVLGTHFNVNSYPNEGTVRTTLLEGLVRVISLKSFDSKELIPGQQSTIVQGKLEVGNADMESVMAWKKGDFVFNDERLTSIMKKLERWYDIEVIYELEPSDVTFSGVISRSKKLSAVLTVIEQTSEIKFKIEGRRVYVKT